MFFLLDFSSRHLLTRAIVLYGDPGFIFLFLFRSPYMIMKESVCKVLIRSKFVCVLRGWGTELNAFIRFDKPRGGRGGNEVVVVWGGDLNGNRSR